MSKTVFLAAGHGGTDPGAVAYGLKEKDLNLTTMLACKAELERNGVTVLTNRTTDVDVELAEKCAKANNSDAVIAVSIHHNAGGGDGLEIFHWSTSAEGKRLGELCAQQIKALGQNMRSPYLKAGDGLYFIRHTLMPAILIEVAFLDNDKDNDLVDTAAEQKAMGVAIAKGIMEHLGVKYVAPVPHGLYRVQVGAFKEKANADKQLAAIKKAGFTDAILVKADGLYKVQVGAYAEWANASKMLHRIKNAGYNAFITEKAGTVVSAAASAKKSNKEIAQEVIRGEWGNGAERTKRLTIAGYDPEIVQAYVNEML